MFMTNYYFEYIEGIINNELIYHIGKVQLDTFLSKAAYALPQVEYSYKHIFDSNAFISFLNKYIPEKFQECKTRIDNTTKISYDILMGIEYIKKKFEKTLSDESNRALYYIEMKHKELKKKYDIEIYHKKIQQYRENPSPLTFIQCTYNISDENKDIAIAFFKNIISDIDIQTIDDISDRDNLDPDIASIFNNEISKRLFYTSEKTKNEIIRYLSDVSILIKNHRKIEKRINNLISYILAMPLTSTRNKYESERNRSKITEFLQFIIDNVFISRNLYFDQETKDKVQAKIYEINNGLN